MRYIKQSATFDDGGDDGGGDDDGGDDDGGDDDGGDDDGGDDDGGDAHNSYFHYEVGDGSGVPMHQC